MKPFIATNLCNGQTRVGMNENAEPEMSSGSQDVIVRYWRQLYRYSLDAVVKRNCVFRPPHDDEKVANPFSTEYNFLGINIPVTLVQ